MAKPYKEGKGWCVRERHAGHDIYLSGYSSNAAVSKAVRLRKVEIDQGRAPRHPGPARTTLAQALQTYALERLRFLKGAVQEAVRINNYLRYAGLELLEVKPASALKAPGSARSEEVGSVYFSVTLKPHSAERKIPKGLAAHRKAQLTKNANTEKHRAVLASKRLSDITRSDMQGLIDAMRDDANAAATVALERAMLRGLFNYAKSSWRWLEHIENPAAGVKMPRVNNVRKRSMSLEEQAAMDLAIADCRNKLFAPTIDLLRETGMRASEPLEHALWKNVDWERRVLTLDDGKTGGREVPLSPAALDALKQLEPGAPDEPIVRITYEALRGAWNDARERAGVKDLNLHDLRRTAATRMALKTGNVFLVQALTGHKTLQMAMRYMNVTADDAVAALHAAVAPQVPPVQEALQLTDAASAPSLSGNGTVSLTLAQLHELMSMRSSDASSLPSEPPTDLLASLQAGSAQDGRLMDARTKNVVAFPARALDIARPVKPSRNSKAG